VIGEAVDDRWKSRLVRTDDGQRRRWVEFGFGLALKYAAGMMEPQSRHGHPRDDIVAVNEPIGVGAERS
jgi:hypothetical protein